MVVFNDSQDLIKFPNTLNFQGSPSTSVLLTKDLYSSKWSRQLPEKCSGKQKTLLITVISAPDHFEERQAIRKGWGKTALKMPKVAFIFMVGIQVCLNREY